MSEFITLIEALEILDVRDPTGLTEIDFARLKRRAQQRWHPDKIVASNPSAATLEHYARNFRLIKPAVALLREYVETDYRDLSAPVREPEPPPPPPETPEEAMRRNAPTMQEELRQVWAAVQRTGYKMHEEEFTAFDGWTVQELLQRELADEVPVVAVAAFWGVGFLSVPLYYYFPEAGFSLAVGLAVLGIFCTLTLLPLARFWLPSSLWEVAFRIENVSLAVYNGLISVHNWLARHGLGGFAWLLGLALFTPIRMARLIQNYLLAPPYRLVGWLFRNRRLGIVRKTQRYYAGLAGWYVEELLAGVPRAMSEEQLYHLSRLYAELRDAPV